MTHWIRIVGPVLEDGRQEMPVFKVKEHTVHGRILHIKRDHFWSEFENWLYFVTARSRRQLDRRTLAVWPNPALRLVLPPSSPPRALWPKPKEEPGAAGDSRPTRVHRRRAGCRNSPAHRHSRRGGFQ